MATVSFDQEVVVQEEFADNLIKASRMVHDKPKDFVNRYTKDEQERNEQLLRRLSCRFKASSK